MNLTERKREEHRSRLLQRVGAVLVAVSLMLSLAAPPPAKAIVGVDDAAVVAIVAAFLASCGITFAVSGMDASGVKEQLGVQIDQWVTETGNDLVAWLSGEYVTYNPKNGSIAVSAESANMLSSFAEWLHSKIEAANNAYSIYSMQAEWITDVNGQRYQLWQLGKDTSDGVQIPYNMGTVVYELGGAPVTYNFSNGVYCTFYAGTYEFKPNQPVEQAFISTSHYKDSGFVDNWGRKSYGFTIRTNSLGEKQLYVAGLHEGGAYEGDRSYPSYLDMICDMQEIADSVGSENAFLTATGTDVSIPGETDENREVVIVPGVGQGLSYDDMLDAILEAIAAGQLTATRSEEEAGTTAEEAAQAAEAEETEELPDVDELGLPDLVAALTSRFPFSIPWDIARGIGLLAAPPKTPRFEVDFFAPVSEYVGGWKGSTAVVIDFSELALLGQLTRWTSTIGFCLMLASGTKKLLWTA